MLGSDLMRSIFALPKFIAQVEADGLGSGIRAARPRSRAIAGMDQAGQRARCADEAVDSLVESGFEIGNAESGHFSSLPAGSLGVSRVDFFAKLPDNHTRA